MSLVQPLEYWFCLFAAIPLGCAKAILRALASRQGLEIGDTLSLVDRGFVYGIAHVRGGGEKGDAWHDAGRLANKANTFTDFIAVAEHLVRLRLTRAGRIVAFKGVLLEGVEVVVRPASRTAPPSASAPVTRSPPCRTERLRQPAP